RSSLGEIKRKLASRKPESCSLKRLKAMINRDFLAAARESDRTCRNRYFLATARESDE
ncbi:hypothetical protein A2U01_0108849, partial [Trifolium medium]|nr:hypothetical protein [Trifolium medium]